MKISDLKVNSKIVNLRGTITSLGEVQETPQGAKNREGVLSDDEDQVKIVLWDKQIIEYTVGDKILLQGWCKDFPKDSGNLQVSTGKFGKITKEE